MAEHNQLLEETREEVKGIRERQRRAQDEMQKVEDDLMGTMILYLPLEHMDQDPY